MKRKPSDMPDRVKPGKAEGLVPDADSKYAHLYVKAESERDEKPHARDTPFRYSSANQCARALSYGLQGVEREPFDAAAFTNFRLGTHVHDAVQAELPEAEHEVASQIGSLISGSADTLDGTELVEYKTCADYAYKKAVGAFGPAEGPKTDHMVQVALNIRGLREAGREVKTARIVYFAKCPISTGIANKKGIPESQRHAAEWSFDADDLVRYADKEVARLERVLELHEQGEMAPRHVPFDMPPGARVVDPSRGDWVLEDGEGITDTGSTWRCGYCAFQQHCINEGN